MARLIIISNRLPIKGKKTDNNFVFKRSEGGLATGLGSLQTSYEKYWIGWPGIFAENQEDDLKIRHKLEKDHFYPVFLNEDQIQDYYEGYSNGIIWPLCHYFYSYVEYETKLLDVYREVNQIFCDEALKIIQPGDTVWIQDYQLMLLPAMLREKMPDINIGYFHHIPFPSYEMFRVLPERAEIIKGLLGADLIGFHTHDYMRHFINAAYRILGLDCELDEIHVNNRVVRVDAFPMGINYDMHFDAINKKSIQKKVNSFRKNFGDNKLVLSVDRLDYSKGILHRIKGFELFLENHPEFIGKVSLVMVVVPSRDQVKKYATLKKKINETIGAINGKYSSLNWRPICYFYRSFDFDDLMALYHMADVALVTPLRDGMNLVAKEYVAVKRDVPGALILSEMAGAANELTEAIIINPNDVEEINRSIQTALYLTEEEKSDRLKSMQKVISKQNVNKWAADFVKELRQVYDKNKELQNKRIGQTDIQMLKEKYAQSKNRLILLDYDGTLVPLTKIPSRAIPNQKVIDVLKKLAADPKNKVVISSGRDADFLDKWLGDIDLTLAAEHGAFYKEHGVWSKSIRDESPLNGEIKEIMQNFVDKTPRSALEEKKTALVWHYRNCDSWLAHLREKQLINALITPCSRLNLHIMRGNKIVEVKPSDSSKGKEVLRLLEKDKYDFIIAMGDDVTDEDMFHALPPEAISVKVNSFSDYAQHSIPQSETISFLDAISE